jgi:hypothetical protein
MSDRFLTVVVRVPRGASISETRDYIRAELAAAGGQLRPEDPLFEGVEVVSISAARKVASNVAK